MLINGDLFQMENLLIRRMDKISDLKVQIMMIKMCRIILNFLKIRTFLLKLFTYIVSLRYIIEKKNIQFGVKIGLEELRCYSLTIRHPVRLHRNAGNCFNN